MKQSKYRIYFLPEENMMKVTDKLSEDDMMSLGLSAERYILSLIFNIVCMDQAHIFLGTH